MFSHWNENDITVNGHPIHYSRTGDGGKPPVVLAHGFSDSGKCWVRAALSLENEYDLILPDARGHGRSARISQGEQPDMVADLAGLIQGLGLDRPVVGGHSMGAGVSAGLAAQYPQLVRALILEDPAWFDPKPVAEETSENQFPQPNPFAMWLMTVKGKPIEEVMAKCRADSPTWSEIELPPWAESKQQFDLGFLQARGGPREDWRETARKIACPTLLITAETEKGAIISPAAASEAASLNLNIQVVKIDGAGHNIRRENFEAYLSAVKAFLAVHAR